MQQTVMMQDLAPIKKSQFMCGENLYLETLTFFLAAMPSIYSPLKTLKKS
jgi:hypothetical protein